MEKELTMVLVVLVILFIIYMLIQKTGVCSIVRNEREEFNVGVLSRKRAAVAVGALGCAAALRRSSDKIKFLENQYSIDMEEASGSRVVVPEYTTSWKELASKDRERATDYYQSPRAQKIAGAQRYAAGAQSYAASQKRAYGAAAQSGAQYLKDKAMPWQRPEEEEDVYQNADEVQRAGFADRLTLP